MEIAWGFVIVIAGLVSWLGQAVTAVAPEAAVKLGVTEAEADVDPTYYADVRGEAWWDATTNWTLPLAGLLLIIDSDWWPHLGLVGGGMYLYFAGRGIVTRRFMQARGIEIGRPAALSLGYVALAVWGIVGTVTIIAAAVSLEP